MFTKTKLKDVLQNLQTDILLQNQLFYKNIIYNLATWSDWSMVLIKMIYLLQKEQTLLIKTQNQLKMPNLKSTLI